MPSPVGRWLRRIRSRSSASATLSTGSLTRSWTAATSPYGGRQRVRRGFISSTNWTAGSCCASRSATSERPATTSRAVWDLLRPPPSRCFPRGRRGNDRHAVACPSISTSACCSSRRPPSRSSGVPRAAIVQYVLGVQILLGIGMLFSHYRVTPVHWIPGARCRRVVSRKRLRPWPFSGAGHRRLGARPRDPRLRLPPRPVEHAPETAM